jgi:hypothetical protein
LAGGRESITRRPSGWGSWSAAAGSEHWKTSRWEDSFRTCNTILRARETGYEAADGRVKYQPGSLAQQKLGRVPVMGTRPDYAQGLLMLLCSPDGASGTCGCSHGGVCTLVPCLGADEYSRSYGVVVALRERHAARKASAVQTARNRSKPPHNAVVTLHHLGALPSPSVQE